MQYNHESTRKKVYQRITEQVIEALQKGQVPWKKKWASNQFARNVITRRPYRGWNAFYLNYVTIAHQYPVPYFITFKQAKAAGGSIRRGEKGISIIYWVIKENQSPKESNETQKLSSTRMIPKLHTVFNIAQTDGIPFEIPTVTERTEHEKIAACDAIIDAMPQRPAIKHGGDKAFYSPALDYVQLPRFSSFDWAEDYYSVCFHELAHSTGHASRLNRKELMSGTYFGSDTYAKEELTAEMTAAFLCGVTGIDQRTINNSTAYLKSWINKLQNDHTLLVRAASQAQAAADFILNEELEQLPTSTTPIAS